MKTLVAGLMAFALLGCTPQMPVNHTVSDLREATYLLQSDEGLCTAVFIKPQVALTAAHCDGTNLTIEGVKATVVKKNEAADLMLLYVPMNSKYIPVAAARPALDSKVVTVGNPVALGEIITEGRVQGDAPIPTDPEFPQTVKDRLAHYMIITSPIAPGNSGGPVFVMNAKGEYEVVGIVSAVAVATIGGFIPNIIPHLAFVIKTEVVKEFVK